MAKSVTCSYTTPVVNIAITRCNTNRTRMRVALAVAGGQRARVAVHAEHALVAHRGFSVEGRGQEVAVPALN